jgi:hypothetical protein
LAAPLEADEQALANTLWGLGHMERRWAGPSAQPEDAEARVEQRLLQSLRTRSAHLTMLGLSCSLAGLAKVPACAVSCRACL